MPWEYDVRIVSIGAGPGLLQMLNEMGAADWELVAWPVTTEGPRLQTFIFKRPKPSEIPVVDAPGGRAIHLREEDDEPESQHKPELPERGRRRITFEDE